LRIDALTTVCLPNAAKGLSGALRLFWVLVGFAALSVRGADDFIAGADVSLLDFFTQRGIIYRDGGTAQDGLTLLKQRGLNCVRLRLFTSSAEQAASDPYNRINNLDYTLPLAVRAKTAGLRLLLDLHFSDTWADPGHQAKPAAWAGLDLLGLEQRMRAYCSNTITTLKAANALPDYVQVGNEITGGLLWPEGRVGGTYDNQWPQFSRLVKAAVLGIKEASGNPVPKIIIHIDRGGDWGATQWYFDHLTQQQVDFDILGESYYPFWHGSLGALSNCLNNAANRYHKPVIIAETAFPWKNSTNIFGIPASPEGQTQYLATLAQILKSIPNHLGAGVVWWGSEYQPLAGFGLAGFESRSFFDNTGSVLPIASAFGQLIAPLTLNANATPSGVTLTWPLSGAGMVLTTSPKLLPLAPWPLVTNTSQSTGGHFDVSLPIDATQARFYRLESRE
jgi:arabinogalactan endo-1,4-beta-galactosidase